MRALVLALLLVLTLPSSVQAVSYQQTDGTIVDPILYRGTFGGGIHPYCCINLEPSADLRGANLTGADLADANLRAADLSDADLTDADLAGADLSFADLGYAFLTRAVYDQHTLFPSGGDIYSGDWGLFGHETPWNWGMIPGPEPTSGLMLAIGGLALAALGRRASPLRLGRGRDASRQPGTPAPTASSTERSPLLRRPELAHFCLSR